MSMDGIGKTIGATKLAFDTTESMPKTPTQTFGFLKDLGFGLASVFGGPTGAILSSQNDLANFTKPGFEKDPTTRKMGMANSGASYVANMASLFPKTQPFGLMLATQHLAFNVALRTEMNNPGAWENFKQDPMYFDAITGNR